LTAAVTQSSPVTEQRAIVGTFQYMSSEQVEGKKLDGRKWQVSNGGGEQPRWRNDGKEWFYLSPDAKIMAVPVKLEAGFGPGVPVALFQANPREVIATSEQFIYDVDPSGRRFLVNTQVKKTETQPISVILNWDAGLKK
jgi:hypothetical protein